ncbi:MAG: glycoside hydrolase family 15 protein [Ammonifex sp.]|jgi:GH15 family glucan-1,4-alpha-glucosidase|nr:MAG: glycoside hydrolase family 15 protein [Ammonifex sp.]
MPRPLIVGNGKVMVTFDEKLDMRDFFYPHVGQWNHLQGNRNRLGIWVNGTFSWISDDGWERRLGYKQDTLVTEVQASHLGLAVRLLINDAVHRRENIYLKKLVVQNLSDTEREIRVFFGQDFSIDETEVGDTAFYDAITQVLCHYKRNRYLLINGYSGNGRFEQFAAGIKGFGKAEGTWRDAEDGTLSANAIAQGSVDSVMGFNLHLGPWGEDTIYYWICAAKNIQEVRALNDFVLSNEPEELLFRTETFGRAFLEPCIKTCADASGTQTEGFPPAITDTYKRSLLILRAHFDARGAIIASPDSDIMATNRDHYCYLWPRDGAFAAYALIRAGYGRLTRGFFDFCANALTAKGYLLHKYNPDGTAGSSWHPWLEDGVVHLPIQEDETALVLWALWEYYQQERDLEFVLGHYHDLVRPAAHFLSSYIDENLRLPAESYDLWEERRGIFTFTTAAVHAGLVAARNLAQLFGQPKLADKFSWRAAEMQEALVKHLYDKETGHFFRGLRFNRKKGSFEPDTTVDSSLAGVFLFNVLPASDIMVSNTMRQVEEVLRVKTKIGGVARYYGDYYFRQTEDLTQVPGNPWFVSTLWLAQHQIRAARNAEELIRARHELEWCVKYTLPTGVMPEQLHPYTGEALSVAPLNWSHAAFVIAFSEYVSRHREIVQRREQK